MDDFGKDLTAVENTAEAVIAEKVERAKRTNSQAQKLRVEISNLLVRGYKPIEIAERFNEELANVMNYIRSIESDWRDHYRENMDKVKSKELARIDTIETEAWDSWEKSKLGRTKDQVNSEVNIDRNGQAKRNPRVSRTIKESSVGDPKFLEIIMKCVTMRMNIYGLDVVRAAAQPEAQSADTNVLAERIEKYGRSIFEESVTITRRANLPTQTGVDDQHDPREPLDSQRSPRKANEVLDVTGSVR